MKFKITREFDAPEDAAQDILKMAYFFEKVTHRYEEIMDDGYGWVDAVMQVLGEEFSIICVSEDALTDWQEAAAQ